MVEYIDSNFLLHATKVIDLAPNLEVHKRRNITYTNSGLSCDTFNIAHVHGDKENARNEIEEAVSFYRERQLDYCLWINVENLSDEVQNYLEKFGLSQQNAEVGMVLKLDEYTIKSNEKSDNIKQVSSTAMLEEYATVIAENWSPPDQNILKYYSETASIYLDPKHDILLWAYYHEGKPVSTVEMFPSDAETIGLYGFATLSNFRGMGIGSALMTHTLNKAKELGYERVILQGTEDGLGIYQKLGFEAFTTYFEYA